jgi:hypothetical protein
MSAILDRDEVVTLLRAHANRLLHILAGEEISHSPWVAKAGVLSHVKRIEQLYMLLVPDDHK